MMLKRTPKANAKPRFTEKKQSERIMRTALKPRAEKTGGALESAFKKVVIEKYHLRDKATVP